MPCYNTVTGWQHPDGGSLKFADHAPSPKWTRLQVGCNQCIGCRLEHSRQWAMRCVLEARQHKENSFITLTYDDNNLPANKSLDKSHLQKFLKRLRKQRHPFRYYACGEYGDQTKRAHYHACLFGIDFQDKVEFRKINDSTLYISEQLNKIWGYGLTSIGEVNFQTAAYCARYVLKKKLTVSKQRQSHYYLEEETGELIPVIHPYAAMSLRKAIGKEWLHKNHGDIYNADKDYLVIKGQELKPPKYFDKLYDTINPERMERIRKKRKEERTELTLQELRTHEKITRARLISRKQV